MKPEEFLKKYANLPLEKRMVEINDKFRHGENKRYCNMNHIYHRIKEIQDLLLPHHISLQEWCQLGAEGFKQLDRKDISL